jgi:hypothetical protein
MRQSLIDAAHQLREADHRIRQQQAEIGRLRIEAGHMQQRIDALLVERADLMRQSEDLEGAVRVLKTQNAALLKANATLARDTWSDAELRRQREDQNANTEG